MAQTNNTPVTYWLSIPLSELNKWIKASNIVVEEAKERAKKITRKGAIYGEQKRI